ncbi:hypothetical protein FH5_03616 [Priestia endophytica]|nr:hypothetical protein FH5_03616 [Priestia endophytica]
MIIYISSHSPQCRSHLLDNNEEDEGKDKAVDNIVIVVYKKYYHDEIVEDY